MAAKVTFRESSSGYRAIGRVMKSDALAVQLEALALPVYVAARRDPNPVYVATVRMRRFFSRGARGRVSIQIGAEGTIGARVEAKRGTLARALGRGGL